LFGGILMRVSRESAFWLLVLVTCICCVIIPGAADAAYSVGFKSAAIEITSPSRNLTELSGDLTVTGKTDLQQLWLAVRGPGGEIETYLVDPEEGSFTRTISLRFGQGIYTIWAGDNPRKFDGTVRFQVINKAGEDNRYLAPSAYIDSADQDIVKLAAAVTAGSKTSAEKARAIHDWVAANIGYDTGRLASKDLSLSPASSTLEARQGVCSGYAFLTAALARAAGLEARVVYGQAGSDSWERQFHAWNEIKVDGRWVPMDTTWDAGYVKDGKFVRKTGDRYYDNAELFAKTYLVDSYAVY